MRRRALAAMVAATIAVASVPAVTSADPPLVSATATCTRYSPGDTIDTITFVDGMGRAVQQILDWGRGCEPFTLEVAIVLPRR